MSIMTIKTKTQPTFSGADSTENDLNHASITPLRQTYCDGPLSVNLLISVTDDKLPEQASNHRNNPDNCQS